MTLLLGEFTLARLQAMDQQRIAYWKALCASIPHLPMRLELILEVKQVHDLIVEQMGGGVRKDPEVDAWVRFSLLTVALAFGAERLRKWLEERPLAVVCAASGIFAARNDWIQDGEVNHEEFLANFLLLLTTTHHSLYAELREDGEVVMDLNRCLEDLRAYGHELGLSTESIEALIDLSHEAFMTVEEEMAAEPMVLNEATAVYGQA